LKRNSDKILGKKEHDMQDFDKDAKKHDKHLSNYDIEIFDDMKEVIRTRKNLKYVIVPVETVRSVAIKRAKDQVRLEQVPDDLIQSLEELIKTAKDAKAKKLIGKEEETARLALAALAW